MRAITLFCGAGGSCLGMRQAGVEVLAGLDMDTAALATYAAAGGHAVQHMITEKAPVPPDRVVEWAGLDLIWASPPCQPWSRAGKGLGAEDERDAWPATLAAVRLLRPRWFVAENVRGVEVHLDDYVVPALQGMGYTVSWRVLDAADYGLPQRRHRAILVAGPTEYRWPRATHGDPATLLPMFETRKPWTTMGEALGIVAIYPEFAYLLDHPSPCVTATEVKGHTNPDRDRGRASAVQRASDVLRLARGLRRLTWQECATLQGFPADYSWQGNIIARYRQIGNAVPPVLSRVVVEGLCSS